MNGCFQFFFSSKCDDLPDKNVPTRDVTNTWKMGNKTEPHFEKMMENWCPCRARSVTANVKKARSSPAPHCMILTTNHPKTGKNLAVGVLFFSRRQYGAVKARYPDRWNDKKYLPYVGSKQSKLVSFKRACAFDLGPWMKANHKRYLPGKRHGVVNAEPKLLMQILQRFAKAPNQISRFLANVRHLERKLKADDSVGLTKYLGRKEGQSYKAAMCSVRKIRRAQC